MPCRAEACAAMSPDSAMKARTLSGLHNFISYEIANKNSCERICYFPHYGCTFQPNYLWLEVVGLKRTFFLSGDCPLFFFSSVVPPPLD